LILDYVNGWFENPAFKGGIVEVSRRNFIKITGASAAALALGYDAEPSKAC
jgi:hypothetical protein